jgi:hypothetical protein
MPSELRYAGRPSTLAGLQPLFEILARYEFPRMALVWKHHTGVWVEICTTGPVFDRDGDRPVPLSLP